MSNLILNKTSILAASLVFRKTKEIVEIWRDVGNSVKLQTSIARQFSIEEITPNDNMVHVKILERF